MILFIVKILKYFLTYMEEFIETKQEVTVAKKNLLDVIGRGQYI